MTARDHFTDTEMTFLHSGDNVLGRIATVGPDGAPHVVPSGWTFNVELGTLDVTGSNLDTTKKYRDVQHTGRAAIVIDGIADGPGWNPWGLEICGDAEAILGPPALIRIHPQRIASWNLTAAIRG